MSEEEETKIEGTKIVMYCKFCDTDTEQIFKGDDRSEGLIINFYCPKCGSFHTFEFFGSEFQQDAELD